MGCDEVCTVEGFLLPRGKTSERGRWLLGMVRGGGRRPGSGGLQWGGLVALRRMLPCCCWVQGGMRCERYSGAGGWWCVRRRVFSYPGVRERESSGYRVAGSSGGRGCDVLAALRRVVVFCCW